MDHNAQPAAQLKIRGGLRHSRILILFLGEPFCMNDLYFLVKDEDELRDKVWKNLFDAIVKDGKGLRIEELKADGIGDKKLFKVWIEPRTFGTITAPVDRWRDYQITCTGAGSDVLLDKTL